MARKSFALRSQPHVAEIGDVELLFRPEVMGDEYLDAFQGIQDARARLGDLADPLNVDLNRVRELNQAARDFLSGLMLPESAEQFAEMPLPDRVLGELVEWAVELYGGERPPTSSTGSVASSPPPGTSGRAASRSKAPTRTRGR